MGKYWTLPPRTEEHRRKISEAQKRRLADPAAREALSVARRGRPISEEHKQKIRETLARSWADPEKRGAIRASKLKGARQSSLRARPSELRMAEILRAGGVEFEFQKIVGDYVVDFFVEPNLVIEVDGEFWHSQEHKIARDAERDAGMAAMGLRVVHVPDNMLTGTRLRNDKTRTKERPCSNCATPARIIRKGRCTPCAAYFNRNKKERPEEMWGRACSDATRANMRAAAIRRNPKDENDLKLAKAIMAGEVGDPRN